MDGAERDHRELGEDQQQRDRHRQLRRRQRHQHQEVGGPRTAAAPAREPDREQDAERRRDRDVQQGELEAVRDGVVEVGLWKTENGSSPVHQRGEKPRQTLRERPSLNEIAIANSAGISAQIM